MLTCATFYLYISEIITPDHGLGYRVTVLKLTTSSAAGNKILTPPSYMQATKLGEMVITVCFLWVTQVLHLGCKPALVIALVSLSTLTPWVVRAAQIWQAKLNGALYLFQPLPASLTKLDKYYVNSHPLTLLTSMSIPTALPTLPACHLLKWPRTSINPMALYQPLHHISLGLTKKKSPAKEPIRITIKKFLSSNQKRNQPISGCA